MLSARKIQIWVSGMLFLWLLSVVAPSVVFFISDSTDSIALAGNLEEEPQPEEKKEDSKKDRIFPHTPESTQENFYWEKRAFVLKQGIYKNPIQELDVPPPELG